MPMIQAFFQHWESTTEPTIVQPSDIGTKKSRVSTALLAQASQKPEMRSPEALSETEATLQFVQPLPGEALPTHLKRCIPRIQTKRAQAYNRLESALRASQPPHARGETKPAGGREPDYASVCANVTEDLKLCSEGVIELRALLSGGGGDTEKKEVDMAVAWLDQLQGFEERKLVATVSKHVLVRSESVERKGLGDEQVREKVGRYGRELCVVDEGINELMQEMREYFLEFESGE